MFHYYTILVQYEMELKSVNNKMQSFSNVLHRERRDFIINRIKYFERKLGREVYNSFSKNSVISKVFPV